MSVGDTRLASPQPVDLVREDEAKALIESAERGLAQLEELANAASLAAEQAEEAARAEGAQAGGSPWAMIRLQGFLDDLRTEVDHDVELLLATAHRQADARLEEARRLAELTRAGLAEPLLPPPAPRAPSNGSSGTHAPTGVPPLVTDPFTPPPASPVPPAPAAAPAPPPAVPVMLPFATDAATWASSA